MSGGIGDKPISFQKFISEVPADEQKGSVAEIARKYLGISGSESAQSLDPSRFNLPDVKSPTLFDWVYDFVMHFIKGHNPDEIARNEKDVITILTKSPLEATGADQAQLNALKDFVPSHYKERFSRWNENFQHYAKIAQTLSLSHAHIKAELKSPLNLEGLSIEEAITLVQRRIGYALLGEKDTSLKPEASRKYNEALGQLAHLFTDHVSDESHPFAGRQFVLETLLESPAIDETTKNRVRDYVNLEDARSRIRDYDPDDSMLIAQSLAAIREDSSLYSEATKEIWHFYLDHESEFKSVPFMDLDHMESRLEGLSVNLDLGHKLLHYFLKTERPEKALFYETYASAEDLTKIGQAFLKKDELGKALDYFEPAAASGDLEAKFEIGKAYIHSQNTTRRALAAKYLEEVRAAPQHKKFENRLTQDDAESVGQELFKEGRYKEAAFWLKPYAKDKPELRWMCIYGDFLTQKDNPSSERPELGGSLIKQFTEDASETAPQSKALLGINELFLFEKNLKPVLSEDLEEGEEVIHKEDFSHFMNAINFFETADKTLLKEFALPINLGLNKLITHINEEERAADPQEVETADKALRLLQTIPDITLSPTGLQEASLHLAESYRKLKSSHGKLTAEEQVEALKKSAGWLIKAGPLAPVDFVDELTATLLVQGGYPDLVSQLAMLKVEKETKPASPLTQAARLMGLVKEEEIPKDAIFTAASSFLETIDGSFIPSLERLAPLENTAVLNKLSGLQLYTLLTQILQKLHPEIPEETTAIEDLSKGVEALTKGVKEAVAKASYLLTDLGAKKGPSSDAAGGAGAPANTPEPEPKVPVKGLFNRFKESAKNAAGIVKKGAASVATTAKHAAAALREGAKDAASTMKEGAGAMASNMKEGARHAATAMQEGAKHAAESMANPVSALTAMRGSPKAPISFSSEDSARIGSLITKLEKALIAKNNYSGTLALGEYLLKKDQNEEARKKLEYVIAHSENKDERERAALLLSEME